ncbi:glycoside hydrolase family 7 protein [Hypholoma sublateritium FD-334 SS-4]|uniref:Glucanase n=1 Tax=Hypholoma sublateritium (strain FD-334 SS-4) TaxID=945553 RepID=A0A0D2NII4_HYPSF|nr:glycoside hydrolase family 7 protein [Hypholoma sublateritium FD-334 SS-4]
MFHKVTLLALSLVSIAWCQLVGTYQTETHPALPFQRCTKAGGCTTVSAGQVVLDSNWRWVHAKDGYTNCYTGNTWNSTACPDGKTCAANCALDGADYPGTYGISVSGNALTLRFVTSSGSNKNIGSRVYLMNSDSKYELFKVSNQEFTFDVDVSNLPCGLNGALYFSEMDEDGGLSKYPTNKAGAKYGTGYCDSQCPTDMKLIAGEANVEGWTPVNDANAGNGKYGTCCNEMDIWEANSMDTAYTPHPCTVTGPYRCTGTTSNTPTDRYGGVCDPDGCDFNSYRMGDKTFGPGATLDTKKKMTVVTQFITSDGTAAGSLAEIRRIYVQDGKKKAFGDTDSFLAKGGMKGMEAGLRNGTVLALSVWDDHVANMLWLDSTYPTTSTGLGAARGACVTTSGDPKDVEANNASASVIFSNIKVGDIGTTFSGTSGGTTTPGTGTTTTKPSSSTTSSAPGATQTEYGQWCVTTLPSSIQSTE